MEGNTSSTIVAAIRELGSDDPKQSARAREALERMGKAATWHLVQAAYPSGKRTRHEALKALVNLADPAAADLFAECLGDEESDCRWLAAEGLAALGEEGLRRTLTLLLEFPRTDPLLRALHHVLSESQKSGFEDVVAPVLRAFQGPVPQDELPAAAHRALDELRKARRGRPDRDTPTAS